MSAVDELAPERPSLLARIRSGAWLDAQTFAPLSWAVPGMVPEGFGLLTGPPKVAKSWLSLDIVLAVASGGRALGKVPVGEPRPTLLLALEDGDRRLQDRCRRLLSGQPIPDLLDYATRATPAEVLPLIREWMDLHDGLRPLVVLDTLGKVMPLALPGESAYARDYRVGGHLKALSDDHPGSAVLVVHHTRKLGSDDWMDSTSGTNGLNGSADFTVSLSRARNEAAGVLKVAGRDVPEGEYALTFDEGRWTIDGASLADAARIAEQIRATAGLGDRSAEIVAFVVAQAAPVTPTQVSEALDVPDARRYLARLVDTGRLARSGRGLYTPVPSVPLSQVGASQWDNGTDGTPLLGECSACGGPMADLGDGATTHPLCEATP